MSPFEGCRQKQRTNGHRKQNPQICNDKASETLTGVPVLIIFSNDRKKKKKKPSRFCNTAMMGGNYKV